MKSFPRRSSSRCTRASAPPAPRRTRPFRFNSKLPQKVIYSLDIYARTNGPLELTAATITEWHTRAHLFIMDAFLESLTTEARARFKERTS